MCGLHQVEYNFAISDIDGGPLQLFVEGGVVQKIQVLEQQQSCRLIIRI
jgi:hypothetical protein